jgi:TolA-binding protein
MKRTERHHLKENELESLVRQGQELMSTRQREATMILGAVVAAAVIAAGYFGWRENVQGKASGLLAEAVAIQDARIGPPPAPGQPEQGLRFATERERAQAALTKLKIAADAYPTSSAGVYARYQQAATYMTLGDMSGAVATYQQVIDRSGNGIIGQMAKLGLAEAQARSGQFDPAIKTYAELSQRKDGPLPVDAILMQLGRVYLEAGKRTEAQQAFNRLVDEFPESQFSTDAKRELDTLKKT